MMKEMKKGHYYRIYDKFHQQEHIVKFINSTGWFHYLFKEICMNPQESFCWGYVHEDEFEIIEEMDESDIILEMI